MTKEKWGKLLTVRWNNWLTLAFGLPTLIYVGLVLSLSDSIGLAWFIGIVVLGAVY